MPILLRLLVCFLIGSVPFAAVAMWGSGIDIRRVGSGNPGFNNVLRVSKGRAVIALVGDVGKGFLAVWMWPAQTQADSVLLGWLCGYAAVLGHCYSPFLKFNGGKGIATSAGVMLVLYPVWAAAATAYFILFRTLAGRLKWPEAGALASLSTWTLFLVSMLVFVGGQHAAYAAIMTAILFWRHQRNLQSLLAPSRRGELRGSNLGTSG